MSLVDLLKRKASEYASNPIGAPLSDVGYALDTPGAYLRGVLAGAPGERKSGRDILEHLNLVGKNDTDEVDVGDALGFGLETVLDPFRTSLLAKLGLAAKGIVGAKGAMLAAAPLVKARRATKADKLANALLFAAQREAKPASVLEGAANAAVKVGHPATFAKDPLAVRSVLSQPPTNALAIAGDAGDAVSITPKAVPIGEMLGKQVSPFIPVASLPVAKPVGNAARREELHKLLLNGETSREMLEEYAALHAPPPKMAIPVSSPSSFANAIRTKLSGAPASVKSTKAGDMNVALADIVKSPLAKEYGDNYGLARTIAAQKLRLPDGSYPPDIEDKIHEAVAHGWPEYKRVRTNLPNLSDTGAMRLAMRKAASRVTSSPPTRFVETRPYKGYVDVMDAAHLKRGTLPDLPGHMRDISTPSGVVFDDVLEALPAHTRKVASMLASGMNKAEIMESLGMSKTTVNRIVSDIRTSMKG